ncbi:hypothetical protein GCM10010172_19280 [Paractinoplanes ferrugineus]|uniref:Cupin type-2 domain-containing protein n=1 Tax=Paractinoplanes ferrugineus TaxID=113564 RepID=A0A919J7F7_9ACTN|nr:cupin domain-containing protein [Actinoplanes ferrugineus]GIE16241.1 hypothetical protein Afe05nite_80810 [Actinoplanes ferrugineus]
MTAIPGKIIMRDAVDPVRWVGEQGRFLLRAEDTGGLLSFFEVTTAPGGGPPLHMHTDHDEALLVLDGAYEVRLDDRTVEATPGTVVFSPRNVAHRFRNVLETPSRLMIVATPGGHETFFEDLEKALAAGGPPDPAVMAAIATRHGVVGLEPMRPPQPAGSAAGGGNGSAVGR